MLKARFVCAIPFSTHVAFTDLIAYKNYLYLCVREGSHHLSFDGKILVFRSRKGEKWSLCAELSSPRYDLRDPKWFFFEGALTLLIPARDEKEKRENFVVPFGGRELKLHKLPLHGLVCWRPKSRGRWLYIPAYEPRFEKRNWRVYLLRTANGKSFARETILDRGWGNETEVSLARNRTFALVRREGLNTILALRTRTGWKSERLPFCWHAPAWRREKREHIIAVRELYASLDPPESQCFLYYGRSLHELHRLPLTKRAVADMGYCGIAFFDRALWVSLYEGDAWESRVWIGAFSRTRQTKRKGRFKGELSPDPVFSYNEME